MAQRKASMYWTRPHYYVIICTTAGTWAHGHPYKSLRAATKAMDLFLRTGKRL